MRSLRLCGGAAALLTIVVPALAGPVLTFDGTDFEATMGYNTLAPGDWPTSQSETYPVPDPVDSLDFPNDSIYENYLFEPEGPIDQAWYVLAEQTYEGGSDYPTLHYTFHRLFASPIAASYPLMLGLQNVNDVAMTALELPGPISGTFTYNLPGSSPLARVAEPFSWTLGSGWTLVPTGDGQYDLQIPFGAPSDTFPELPEDAQIFEVELAFEVIPEPPTISLLAVWFLASRRRRRR